MLIESISNTGRISFDSIVQPHSFVRYVDGTLYDIFVYLGTKENGSGFIFMNVGAKGGCSAVETHSIYDTYGDILEVTDSDTLYSCEIDDVNIKFTRKCMR